MRKIGIIHPGDMGVSVAASAINSGHEVYWASQGRSPKTRERAEKHQLRAVHYLSELCETCEIIFSICPPHAADEVAQSIIEVRFQGLYLDANAIAPERVNRMGQRMESAGIRFVDGGIIGEPAWAPKETWLYLSGIYADEIAACFSKGPLEAKIIGTDIGKASALKMCYAAYSKGTTALLASILTTAEALNVRENLYEHWDMDNEDFSAKVNQRIRRVTAKAWRFEGEMREIAATFRAAGLPDGFQEAAAELYGRMANFKNTVDIPKLEEVLQALRKE